MRFVPETPEEIEVLASYPDMLLAFFHTLQGAAYCGNDKVIELNNLLREWAERQVHQLQAKRRGGRPNLRELWDRFWARIQRKAQG